MSGSVRDTGHDRHEPMTTRDGRTICVLGGESLRPAPSRPRTDRGSVAELVEPPTHVPAEEIVDVDALVEAERFVPPSYDPDEREEEIVELPERPVSSLDEARAQRDAALVVVEENAGEVWNVIADGFVYKWALAHRELFSPDLYEAGLPKPPEPRALGPVILRARRNGWIESTGEFRPSQTSRTSPRRVWRSRIYEGNE